MLAVCSATGRRATVRLENPGEDMRLGCVGGEDQGLPVAGRNRLNVGGDAVRPRPDAAQFQCCRGVLQQGPFCRIHGHRGTGLARQARPDEPGGWAWPRQYMHDPGPEEFTGLRARGMAGQKLAPVIQDPSRTGRAGSRMSIAAGCLPDTGNRGSAQHHAGAG